MRRLFAIGLLTLLSVAAFADEAKEERRLNDENARRVKDLEDTLEALEETILWMRSQEEDVE